jgi:hypothetical protein
MLRDALLFHLRANYLLQQALSLRKPIVASDASSWLRRTSVILVGLRRGNSIAASLIVLVASLRFPFFGVSFFYIY